MIAYWKLWFQQFILWCIPTDWFSLTCDKYLSFLKFPSSLGVVVDFHVSENQKFNYWVWHCPMLVCGCSCMHFIFLFSVPLSVFLRTTCTQIFSLYDCTFLVFYRTPYLCNLISKHYILCSLSRDMFSSQLSYDIKWSVLILIFPTLSLAFCVLHVLNFYVNLCWISV